MTEPTNGSEWRWRMTQSENDVDELQKWQRQVIAEITQVKTDMSTIKDWVRWGIGGMLGMTGSIVVWLLTGHKP